MRAVSGTQKDWGVSSTQMERKIIDAEGEVSWSVPRLLGLK